MHILLNWLGQGALVALAAAAVLRIVPRSRTQARYCLCWVACLAVCALPALALVGTGTESVIVAAAPGPDASAERSLISIPSAWWTSTVLMLGLCVAWSAVQAIRLMVAVVTLRTVRRGCGECPSELQSRLECWSRVRTTGRPTRIVLSSRVRCAAVLGCGSPLVALTPGLVEALTADDLDRVVLHEWAHVQRHDDIAQFVQRLVHAVAGWHPAIVWLQRQLELEREVACDEIAVAVTGSPKRYAACLATLAALPLRRIPALPVPAVSSSRLRRRIVRILAGRSLVAARPWRAITLCGSSALAVVAIAVASLEVAQASTAVTPRLVVSPDISTTLATPVAAVSAMTPGEKPRPRSNGRPRTTKALDAPLRVSGASQAEASQVVETLSVVAQTPRPSGAANTVAAPVSIPLTAAFDLGAAEGPHVPELVTQTPPAAAKEPASAWAPFADAGIAMGRGSQTAGVATAGFFTRLGKKIARSF